MFKIEVPVEEVDKMILRQTRGNGEYGPVKFTTSVSMTNLDVYVEIDDGPMYAVCIRDAIEEVLKRHIEEDKVDGSETCGGGSLVEE